MTPAPHRLVTRSDFDGLVCAVLLRSLGLIDEITFVHPKDVQDGVVDVTERDILTNLPYAPGRTWCSTTTTARCCAPAGDAANHVIDPRARRRPPGSCTSTTAAPPASRRSRPS